jgi:hypothetical protein
MVVYIGIIFTYKSYRIAWSLCWLFFFNSLHNISFQRGERVVYIWVIFSYKSYRMLSQFCWLSFFHSIENSSFLARTELCILELFIAIRAIESCQASVDCFFLQLFTEYLFSRVERLVYVGVIFSYKS